MSMKWLHKIAVACAVVGAAWVHAGSVKVPEGEDIVRLVDGREFRGTVLCRGPRKIIMLVGEKEMEFEPSRVASVKKVKVPGEVSSFLTAPVDGTEKIVGRGTAPAAAGEGGDRGGAGNAAARKKAPVKGLSRKAGTRGKKKGGTARAGSRKPSLLEKLKELRKEGKIKGFFEKSPNLLQNKDVRGLLEELSRRKPFFLEKLKELRKEGKIKGFLEKSPNFLQNKDMRKLLEELSK